MTTPMRFCATEIDGAQELLAAHPEWGVPWTPRMFAAFYTELMNGHDKVHRIMRRREARGTRGRTGRPASIPSALKLSE